LRTIPLLPLVAALALSPAARATSNYTTPYAFTTVSGIAGITGLANGQGTIALFNTPSSIAVDSGGNVYITDSGNATVRKMSPKGDVTTFAGSPGIMGTQDGTGSAAQFGFLVGLAVDTSGNVYVSDAYYNTIRKITPTGVVTTLAGSAGVTGYANGTGHAAQFNEPADIGVDGNGNVYVADSGNQVIRKVTAAGVVTTLAGTPGISGSANGTGAEAEFNSPDGLTADLAGNAYVADNSNTIRKVTPAGVVSTIAGIPGVTGSSDGVGSAATFDQPAGMAVDASGNLFVADSVNDTIREITPAGVVTTLAGRVGMPGSSDGTGTAALFNQPLGVTVDAGGNLFVADTYNDTIRKGAAAPAGMSPTGGSFPARLINISTRAQVGTGGNILITGFVIGGTGSETLLIRGDGPALTAFSVTGVLAQPTLSVLDSNQNILATNTGWGANAAQVTAAAAQSGAFPLTAGSADCALVITLPAGAYTAEVSGVGGTTGVALAEVYEVSSTGTRLINLSTRAQVGTGGNVLIPGFVISGNGQESLLLRGVGPALAQFGVGGVLAMPELLVFDNSQNTVAADTGWGTNVNAAAIAAAAIQVNAFALPMGSADSATLISLSPGAYTMEISGVGNTTGVALAEVYELP
jgi:hypothetical protein